MSRFLKSTGIIVGIISLSGLTASCAGISADTRLSDTRIASITAQKLGFHDGEVQISDRSSDGITNTYYTASTPGGTYRCSVNGGSLLDAGIVQPPECSKK